MMDDGPIVYRGGCHCGRVAYEVDGPIDGRVIQCNCSICRKKAYLHGIISRERFHLLTPWDDLATYTFNTHTAKHYFCPRCGVASFYIARSNPDQIDVNLRCVDGIELPSLRVELFDGRNWGKAIAAFRDRTR
ncbi:MAG: GFA family protein [Candidatus Binataceae bacterium]